MPVALLGGASSALTLALLASPDAGDGEPVAKKGKPPPAVLALDARGDPTCFAACGALRRCFVSSALSSSELAQRSFEVFVRVVTLAAALAVGLDAYKGDDDYYRGDERRPLLMVVPALAVMARYSSRAVLCFVFAFVLVFVLFLSRSSTRWLASSTPSTGSATSRTNSARGLAAR